METSTCPREGADEGGAAGERRPAAPGAGLRSGRRAIGALTVLGGLLVMGAGFNGASFLDFADNTSSLIMALLAFAAIGVYAVRSRSPASLADRNACRRWASLAVGPVDHLGAIAPFSSTHPQLPARGVRR